MGLKVLITLDLNDASTSQRQEFNSILEEHNWIKVGKLTTTWRCSFYDSVTRESAKNTILTRLQEAQDKTKIKEIEYAFQMDEDEVVIGKKKI